MSHLTSDELIDAMEGLLDAARRPHLDTCETCQRELADLSLVLREAQEVGVPEPSPLFWRHFSDRVRAAVDADSPSAGWARWLRWPLAPIGALALVLVALTVWIPTQGPPPAPQAADVSSAGDGVLAGDSWVMVADLVGDMDWDTASAVGLVVEPGAAEQAVLDLTPDEQRELTRLIRAELQRAKS